MSTQPSLVDRIAALEQTVKQLQSGAFSDQLEPNVLRVNPDGTIGALLTGGLELIEQDTPTLNELEAITFVDAETQSVVREGIQAWANVAGGGVGSVHNMAIFSGPDTDDSAGVQMQADIEGGAGTARITLAVKDSILGLISFDAIRSDGQSGFLQGGSLNPPTITNPAIGVGGTRTPNIKRPTFVIVLLVMSPGSGALIEQSAFANPNASAANADSGNLADILQTLYAFVPAGESYEIVQGSPTVTVNLVTEITL